MKRFITPHIYKYAKNIMPKISETEAAALNSGTSSIEKDLFIGKLNINDIVDKYNVSLSYFEECNISPLNKSIFGISGYAGLL